MKRLIETDRFTGISTYHHYDAATNTTRIEQVQDCKAILDFTKEKANDSSYKRQGIKDEWMHFARVPNVVIHELLVKYNLDINNKDDLPKIEQVIARDYKKLLTVDKI